MGQLVFQATAGGQVALVGPNPSSNFSLNVPAVNGNLVTTGDTGTVTNTMLASSAYTAPGTIGSGTPNSGAFTTLSASSTVSGTGFSTYLASPPAIGGTSPSTGKFTSITNTGLTATQVIYATTGGLETSSANMTFDGTNLTTGGYKLFYNTNLYNVDSTLSNYASNNNVYLNGNAGSGLSLSSDGGLTNRINIYGSTGGNYTAFTTNNAERMRIDSSGRLLLGTTSALSNSLATFGNNTGSPVGWGFATLQNSGGITPPTSAGLSIGWNFSNGGGENNIVYGTSAGATPGLAFSSYNGTTTTERMRIDSSGNVGIGTSSPSYSLQVNGQIASSRFLGGTSYDGVYRYASNGNVYTYSDSSYLAAYTANTERMRIDANGNLLVSCTALPSSSVSGRTIATGYFQSSCGSTTTSYTHFYFTNGNGNVGTIVTNGSLTAYNVSSDRRLKENISPLNNALSTILALKPSEFNYIADPSTQIQGFIADELQQVVPHAVTGEKDALDAEGKPIYQGVDASFLVPHLVAAIQEQQALITTLQTQVAALQAKVGA